jgi:hypothetical protein
MLWLSILRLLENFIHSSQSQINYHSNSVRWQSQGGARTRPSGSPPAQSVMKLRKRRRKRQDHPNSIGYSDDRQEWAEKIEPAKFTLWVRKVFKYFISFGGYSKKIKPMPIKFLFVETSCYYIARS